MCHAPRKGAWHAPWDIGNGARSTVVNAKAQHFLRFVSQKLAFVGRVKIVNNLPNLGQIEKPRFVNFLFADLAELTLGIIRPATERLRVTVAQDYDPELQIHGIAAQISQVLLN